MVSKSNKIFWLRLRTVIFGQPLSTQYAEHARVGVWGGIPIFGSDIISSEGYAPDAILYVLLAAGALGYAYVMQVSLVIVLLLASILLVYRKAIQKYPQGGGSYTIARAYLGENAGLVAGASLSLDYVLTVAVSVSSAIENLTGMFPWLAPTGHKVLADCIVIAFVAWINLRGLKESARIFALPVYLYIICLVGLVGTGIVEIMVHGITQHTTSHLQLPATTGITMTAFLFARAVAGGTTALTGIEAVSNGVTAFKAPSQKRAITTLIILGFIVAFGLIGLVYMAGAYHLVPSDENTTLNQLGLIVFGHTIPYFALMGSVAAILVIAANTPFAGLPILLSLMARDGNAPRYFKNLGDRLVYSAGIWTLFIISIVLILVFHGDTHMMLPLYAIGVLLSFALTGLGLARHTLSERGKGWVKDAVVFIFGGVVSFLVFLVFITTKFTEGAWIVLIILPLLIFFFHTVHRIYRNEIKVLHPTPEALADFRRHYDNVTQRRAHTQITEYRNKIIVPVYDLNLMVLKTLKYAYAFTPQVTAVHVASDPERKDKLLRHWSEAKIEIPLVIVESPYRAIVHDFMKYLDDLEDRTNFDTITVAIPEYIPTKIRYNFLHNQTGQLLKLMLLYRENILVTSVPYHSEDAEVLTAT
ncbi:APC family permease [Desulfosporosinus sp. FKA]|uniref:APC family permease n=1 Tax=Desulfosporosinus sp. FKA TaxID=1969834 RepID=UPI000B497A0C|nr:APC family permease [Desulfosporosinus sp. FKA]